MPPKKEAGIFFSTHSLIFLPFFLLIILFTLLHLFLYFSPDNNLNSSLFPPCNPPILLVYKLQFPQVLFQVLCHSSCFFFIGLPYHLLLFLHISPTSLPPYSFTSFPPSHFYIFNLFSHLLLGAPPISSSSFSSHLPPSPYYSSSCVLTSSSLPSYAWLPSACLLVNRPTPC